MVSGRDRLLAGALAALVALYVLTRLPSLYADYLWFVSLGYDPVFLKRLAYSLVTFVVFAAVGFAGLYSGLYLGTRNVRKYKPYQPTAWLTVGVVLGALLLGLTFSDSWETFLLLLNS